MNWSESTIWMVNKDVSGICIYKSLLMRKMNGVVDNANKPNNYAGSLYYEYVRILNIL